MVQTSYHSINKWAKEAIVLLREGNLAGVRTQLSMIISQSGEQAKENVPEKKKLDLQKDETIRD